MASDVNFKLRFEISNLNYPGNYVYVVLNTLFGCLRGHEGLQMTSEVATDLKFEISGLNNPCSSASLASIVLCLTNLDGRKDNIIHRPAGFAAGKNRCSSENLTAGLDQGFHLHCINRVC